MKIIGEEIVAEQKAILISAVNRVPDWLLTDVLTFHLRSDVEHFGKSWAGNIPAAHLCLPLSTTICLRPSEITPGIIWHEISHVWHFHVDGKQKPLSNKWSAVAGSYCDEVRKQHPFQNAILTEYGRGDLGEDIAEWVKECYRYLEGEWQRPWVEKNPYLVADPRYRKKLALLHEFGFLDNRDYKTLKPLFE